MIDQRQKGFTLVELLILLTIVSVLGLIVLSALAGADAKARRLTCVENLKEVSRMFFLYAESRGKFPSAAADSNPMSAAELLSRRLDGNNFFGPDLLICPSDQRPAAETWKALAPTHLSYFFNLDASPENPDTLLAGDRNVFLESAPVGGYVTFQLQDEPEWGRNIHSSRGNILKADGTVEFVSSRSLKQLLVNSPGRLSFPTP